MGDDGDEGTDEGGDALGNDARMTGAGPAATPM
jgi:hypothetical protein